MRGGLKARLAGLIPTDGFDRPIFILAAPRTGSTLLFECLRRFRGVCHITTEADGLWWSIFPYERSAENSDYVGADEATPEKIRALRRTLYWSSVGARYRRWSLLALPFHLAVRRRIRYLDKTVANAFHLDFLSRAFPGAMYVHLVRDPRETISSMIEGWPCLDRFGKRQLTDAVRACPDATVEHWTYPAPPGWREVLTRPLPEICAWSWLQHVEHIADFLDGSGGPMARVRYDELLSDTSGTLDRLADALGLRWTREAETYAKERPLSRTTVSEPTPDKWRNRDAEAISTITPMIAQAAMRTGYPLDGG